MNLTGFVFCLDETSIAHQWSYEKGADTIHLPKREVQCVMLRGLTTSWKQLVFYFDTNMNEDILFDLTVRLEGAGMLIAGMVNDLAPSNINLWNGLDVNVTHSSFTNQAASDREIHVFADAPHLLKLIRNNFLDHGFALNSNVVNLSNNRVRELVIRSTADLKTAHRLS